MNRSLVSILPRAAAAAAGAIALAALAGWTFDAAALRSVVPREAPLEANAAFALVLAALALFRASDGVGADRTSRLLALAVLAIGVATLSQYLFEVDLRIDELLFRDLSEVPGVAPGRMSPYSAVALVGIGLALLAFHVQWLQPMVWSAAALATLIGGVPIAGHLFNAGAILGNRWLSPLAASIAFVLLGLGTLVASARTPPGAGAPALRSAIEKKVIVAFAGALLLLCISAGFTYRATAETAASLDGIARLEHLRDTLAKLSLAISGAEAAQTAYLLTSRQDQRDEYERLAASARAHAQTVAAALSQETDQASDLKALRGRVEQRLAVLATVTMLFDETGLSSAREALATDEGARHMRAIAEITRRIDERGDALLLQREATLRRSRELTLGSLLLTLAVAVGIFLALFRGVSREMRTRVAAEHALRERNQEVVALNSALTARAADVEAANRELESFSYSVSHDLRVPLRHIDGYLEMLLDEHGERLPESARRQLDVISDSSRQMSRLIEDLLAFSRMARTELHSGRVELDGLVEEVVAGLEMQTRGRDIEWRVEPLPAVRGDVAMLRQLLANLISNAVKYTSTRGQARIEVGRAGEEGGRAVFFVRDNGVGFDMAYAGRLFGLFQRLHPAQAFEGTGIGLANVQRIVTRHGGRVWAEAVPDRGATFFFTLEPYPRHETP